jgi:two-component system cell cycle sensor histidine kinase/response regulator CckA
LSTQETILLVEDEAPIRDLMREILTRRGYTVLEAGGSEQALESSERHAGEIDLLITDLTLTNLSGRNLARQIAGRRPGMKVLIVSGFVEEDPPGEDETPRASFLAKPFTPAGLARKVREVLDGDGVR